MNIAGIILAAGGSKRMGSPKALLELPGGTTLLSEQAALLAGAGCDPVVVVVGSAADGITGGHPHLNVSWCINGEWELGQFSSVRAGVAHVLRHDIEGALILPVDVAGVSPSTLAALSEAASRNPKPYAVVPSFGGRGGHPIYISLAFCAEIVKKDPSEEDARLDAMFERADKVVYLPVNDANVVRNVNTPDEWRIFLGEN